MRRRPHFVRTTDRRRAKAFRKRFQAWKAALLARVTEGLSGPALDAAEAEFRRRTGKP